MTASNPPPPLPRNRHTQAKHERETFWQIYFPIGLATLAVIAVGVLVGLAGARGGGSNRLWADISLIFLIVQFMALALPLLIMLAALAIGIQELMTRMPPYFKIAQDFMARVARQSTRIMRYASEPVLKLSAAVNSFDSFVSGVMRFFGRG